MFWLCQTCAKLIDNDISRYPAETLREWKRRAEAEAARALEHRRDADRRNENAVSKAMRLMPELLAEMKNDLRELPLCREFVVLKKTWTFWYPEHRVFTYYYEDHPDLDNKLRLLENLGLIRDVQGDSNVAHFVLEEPFADHLATT